MTGELLNRPAFVSSENRAALLSTPVFRASSPAENMVALQLTPTVDEADSLTFDEVRSIVVGRISSAVLDPDYSYRDPWVLTRYDVQLLEVIKPHVRLADGSHIVILHNKGELDWGMYIVRGCYREMRTGETFVLFLKWSEDRHAFAPMGGDALIGNITSGEVAPIRASVTPGPVVTGAIGQPAVAYVRTIREALARGR